MKICTCEKCRYTFRYPLIPELCPDCGAKKVRQATPAEIKDFYDMQKLLEEEIRDGLWTAPA